MANYKNSENNFLYFDSKTQLIAREWNIRLSFPASLNLCK